MDNIYKACFKCKKNFHLNCFRKENHEEDEEVQIKSVKKNSMKSKNKNSSSKIICDSCEHSILKVIKSTKISDYFKPSKNSKINLLKSFEEKNYKSSDNKLDDICSMDSTSLDTYNTYTKNCEAKFKLPKHLSLEQKRILKESLFRALQVKNISFDDNLTYPHEDCPIFFNDASREVGIQKISDYNKQIYYKFKEKTQMAEYPPLEIIDDEMQVK